MKTETIDSAMKRIIAVNVGKMNQKNVRCGIRQVSGLGRVVADEFRCRISTICLGGSGDCVGRRKVAGQDPYRLS